MVFLREKENLFLFCFAQPEDSRIICRTSSSPVKKFPRLPSSPSRTITSYQLPLLKLSVARRLLFSVCLVPCTLILFYFRLFFFRIDDLTPIIFSTPGCSKTHCPSYVRDAAKLKAKGVDTVYCTAVNDPYVLDAWGQAQNAHGKLEFLGELISLLAYFPVSYRNLFAYPPFQLTEMLSGQRRLAFSLRLVLLVVPDRTDMLSSSMMALLNMFSLKMISPTLRSPRRMLSSLFCKDSAAGLIKFTTCGSS